jgi:hypothetical protein
LNEVSVGVCSLDILKQLSNVSVESSSFKELSSSKMDRLVQHLILQKCFLPSFGANPSIPIDLDMLEGLKLKSLPSIMILPSDLPQFIKEIDGVLVINPKKLAGSDFGMFSKIKISESKENMKVKVEILRI